jgi:hypothetical protein
VNLAPVTVHCLLESAARWWEAFDRGELPAVQGLTAPLPQVVAQNTVAAQRRNKLMLCARP